MSLSVPSPWCELSPALHELSQQALPDDWCHVLPPRTHAFNAFELVPPESVRCVILGQDPYPTPGHAHGLAFSVPTGQLWARSLKNIAAEFESDLCRPLKSSDLTPWARSGVLLANTALTVQAGSPGAHAKQWRAFTYAWVTALAALDTPRVWVLWGKHAQKYGPLIRAGKSRTQVCIETPHPSPLSARRGFFGSRPFSRVNAELTRLGAVPIDWYPS